MARPIAINKNQSMQERYPMNIGQELYDAWQTVRRSGDAADMCDELKVSRPILDRALNYGHVKRTSLADRISKYFLKRAKREDEKGMKLLIAAGVING